MRIPFSFVGALALVTVAGVAQAQQRQSQAERDRQRTQAERDRERTRTQSYGWSIGDLVDRDRPVIGISTSSGGDRDTLGVLVESVTRDGPADKAGLREGDRIMSVNGVSLRLAKADLDDRDMEGLMARRLSREIGKAKPGDDVELRVYSGGQTKTVRVKTVAAEDLPGRGVSIARGVRDDERASLGLALAATGSKRDTLGPMVLRVTPDGPAEKAGIVEGDRIASINGIDLRVPREDAGDQWVGSSRFSRFRRELEKLKPGDDAELRVYGGGQTKSVRVKSVRASDLRDTGYQFFIGGGPGGTMVLPSMPAMPTMPSMPALPSAPRPRIYRFDRDGQFDIRIDPDAFRDIGERARDAVRRALEAARLRGEFEIRGDPDPGASLRIIRPARIIRTSM